MRKKNRKVHGVGVNDYQGRVYENGKPTKLYDTWKRMFRRCYYEKYLEERPTYRGCIVCKEWQSLSNFKEWFDTHYVEGWHLDKDLLSGKNKTYSPDTCCFLPVEINTFLSINYSNKGNLPVGISYHKRDKVYRSMIGYKGKTIWLGSSKNFRELLPLYEKEKEREARELADEYKDRLDPRAYDALMRFKTEKYL